MREQSGDWSRLRAPAVGIVLAMLLSLVATTAQAVPSQTGTSTQAAQAARAPVFDNEFGKVKSRVIGTFGQNGTVDAVFKPRRFKAVGTQLVAVGKLQGELVRGNGSVVDDFSQRVELPVATAGGLPLPLLRDGRAATCDILRLVLGPLDLDLLGLQVHLDRVVLNIIAESGAGNLLGNLLCAVAGLLDSTGLAGLAGLLTPVTQILNGILALLRQ
ncbi:MAG TPA: hypothetical protein VFH10_07510 [Nocardioides sp.]|uniref:hypothetical protein n=1 Tax=Nocardioides sp. TaxID=35761 RepID=UPI002D7FFA94|nr:hypothetical protein [Nocardioides sp.]HET6652470.1 hypothetical protein [Nocardioides sp.]